MREFWDFRVDVPEGRHLLHAIRRIKMTERDCLFHDAMEQVMKCDRHNHPGTYTQLIRYGFNDDPYAETVVMSDHTSEVCDHEPLVRYARQHAPLKHVLINGLGIGVAIELLMPYVEHMTIVELSSSVIRLVAPHYIARYGDKLEIIRHDALTYRPPTGTHYDAVFHDIWDTISHKNLAEMRRLHRKYGRRADWQGSWARNYCERDARKRKQHPEQYKDEIDVRDAIAEINRRIASEVQPG
jgi:hypothetical protein